MEDIWNFLWIYRVSMKNSIRSHRDLQWSRYAILKGPCILSSWGKYRDTISSNRELAIVKIGKELDNRKNKIELFFMYALEILKSVTVSDVGSFFFWNTHGILKWKWPVHRHYPENHYPKSNLPKDHLPENHLPGNYVCTILTFLSMTLRPSFRSVFWLNIFGLTTKDNGQGRSFLRNT